MFLELAAAGGGLTYIVRRQRRTPRLIDRLTTQHPRNWSVLKERSEYMSDEERAARRYFKQTSVMLASGVALSLIYPPGLYLMIPGILWGVYPIFRDAYRDLTKEKRVTVIVVDAMLTVMAVVYGTINPLVLLISTFSSWLYSLMLKILASSKSNAQVVLEHLTINVPQTALIARDNKNQTVPFDQIKVGDILIIDGGQPIPVDGVVLEQAAWVTEQLLTGNRGKTEKLPGNEVLAGSVLQSERLKLQVCRLGDETSLFRLRQALENNADFIEEIELRGKAMADRFALPGIALGILAYPFGGFSSMMAVIMMSPCYNMRLLGLLTVMDYLEEAVREGVLIKDGRVLETIDKVDVLILEVAALQRAGITETDLQTTLNMLHEKNIEVQLVSADAGVTDAVTPIAANLGIKPGSDMRNAEQRLQLVETLQANNHCVAYVGDGLRDVVPMQAAQVSVSVNDMASLSNDSAKVMLLEGRLYQLNHLFDLATRFEASMSRSLLTTTAPNAVSIAGSFTGSIGYLGAVGMFYGGVGLGLTNVFWPKIERQLSQLTKNKTQSTQTLLAVKD